MILKIKNELMYELNKLINNIKNTTMINYIEYSINNFNNKYKKEDIKKISHINMTDKFLDIININFLTI